MTVHETPLQLLLNGASIILLMDYPSTYAEQFHVGILILFERLLYNYRICVNIRGCALNGDTLEYGPYPTKRISCFHYTRMCFTVAITF